MITNVKRQIVLDTETTGLNKLGAHYKGHRIIEIGAVEIVNRRLTGHNFHAYLKPDRLIDPEALRVHGISNKFLADKPIFAEIADDFLQFIYGGELVIHNATFDIGFIDHEFSMLNRNIAKVNTFCKITDSLLLARTIFPGKRNSLDALCSRYSIDKNKRNLHGALVDAKLLAEVFLLMTSGQTTICFTSVKDNEQHSSNENMIKMQRMLRSNFFLRVIHASNKESLEHKQYLDCIYKQNNKCLWKE